MKSFLADLDVLRNNCEGQLMELRELISRAQQQNTRTLQVMQKYEHLAKTDDRGASGSSRASRD